MYILGINMSHDRSACLLEDGRIRFAIAEERLDRDKRSMGYVQVGGHSVGYRMPPMRAITYCLKAAGLGLDEVDLVVADNAMGPVDLPFLRSVLPLKDGSKIHALPHPSHHLAHAWSAHGCSPFRESAVLVADVFGSDLFQGVEGESGFLARGDRIEPLFRTVQKADPAGQGTTNHYSLTFIYRFITQALGFTMPYGGWPAERRPDEAGKTMGLAPFGRPVRAWPPLVEVKNGELRTGRFGEWVLDIGIGELREGRLVPVPIPPSKKNLTRLAKDLAFKAQVEIETGLLHLADRLHRETGRRNLSIAGGAGLNSVANKKILDGTPFRNAFIQPAATDDGTALGCALYGWHTIARGEKRFPLKHVYLGRTYDRGEMTAALAAFHLVKAPLARGALLDKAARAIADGKVVGWFQGGSEFGPRALGHRSLLADPRRADMKGRVNEKVKAREPFRPFAPSVLLEHAADYFDLPGPSPFMLLVAEVREARRAEIPAVVHVDGTARVQTVTKRDNGLYHDLLQRFYEITGVPLVLNTSFNTRGEPIVETPVEALADFFRSGMDVLVLGPYLLEKGGRAETEAAASLEREARIMEFAAEVLREKRES